MKVTYPIPSEKVSEYVQRILVIEHFNLTDYFYLPLFANGMPVLLYQTARGHTRNTAGYLTLFGQTISPDRLILNEDFTLIAYFLKPYSLISLFGISAQELTDKPVDLCLVSKKTGLEEQLLNVTGINRMISLLDDYIYSLMSKNKTDERLIRYVVEKISANPYKGILSKIQKNICVTERTFQRMFEKQVGIPANQFRKIYQFNRAFMQLNERQFPSLSSVAFENGYADQSHFIRTFREFTHLTPREYLRLSKTT